MNVVRYLAVNSMANMPRNRRAVVSGTRTTLADCPVCAMSVGDSPDNALVDLDANWERQMSTENTIDQMEPESAVTPSESLLRLLSEIDESPINEDFLTECFRFNDDGSVWWSVVGRLLIKVERAELEDDYGDDDAEWQLSIESELAKHPTVASVPLYRRSQLICCLRGFGIE